MNSLSTINGRDGMPTEKPFYPPYCALLFRPIQLSISVPSTLISLTRKEGEHLKTLLNWLMRREKRQRLVARLKLVMLRDLLDADFVRG